MITQSHGMGGRGFLAPRTISSSIREKATYLTAKIGMVIRAEGCKARMNILVWAMLDSLPRVIAQKCPYIKHKLEAVKNKLARGNIVKIDGNRFYCSDSASILMLSPTYEWWMSRYLRPKCGDVFVDVGAHIGKYVIPTAKVVGESGLVIAIEPHPENYALLNKNIKLNGLKNVVTLNLAVWREDCKLKLFVGESSGCHSLREDVTGHTTSKYIVVEARKLDTILKDFNLKSVDFVKIDVEGAEIEVLEGMKDILKNHAPKVVVEVFDKNYDKFSEIMNIYGYTVENIAKYEIYGYYFAERKTSMK